LNDPEVFAYCHFWRPPPDHRARASNIRGNQLPESGGYRATWHVTEASVVARATVKPVLQSSNPTSCSYHHEVVSVQTRQAHCLVELGHAHFLTWFILLVVLLFHLALASWLKYRMMFHLAFRNGIPKPLMYFRIHFTDFRMLFMQWPETHSEIHCGQSEIT
jgi:hypothetical protein